MLFCVRPFIMFYVQYVLKPSVIFNLYMPYASIWWLIFCLYVPCDSRRSVIYFYITYVPRCQSFYAAGLKIVSYLLLCALCLKTFSHLLPACVILSDDQLSSMNCLPPDGLSSSLSIDHIPQKGQSTCSSMCRMPQNVVIFYVMDVSRRSVIIIFYETIWLKTFSQPFLLIFACLRKFSHLLVCGGCLRTVSNILFLMNHVPQEGQSTCIRLVKK